MEERVDLGVLVVICLTTRVSVVMRMVEVFLFSIYDLVGSHRSR